MTLRTRVRRASEGVSASELAEMGVCERRMVVEQRYGRIFTASQCEDIRRGLHLHAVFDAQSSGPPSGVRGPCFIATHVFGHSAPQTQVLRRYRDRVLRASALGGWSVACYYRVAQLVCGWLSHHLYACMSVRMCLGPVVRYGHWRCRRWEPCR